RGRPDLVLRAIESGKAKFVSGEIIVKYKDEVGAGELLSVRTRAGARLRETLDHRGRGRMEVLALPAGLSVADAVRRFSADAAVEYAEPNWIYTVDATPNDPRYTDGSLWGMYGDASSPANGFGSQAAEAWAADKTNCGAVYVGIIDEGYMYTHEDLAANAAVNPGEIAGNGRDDDGNGLVDDVYGWDFDGGNNSVFDGVGDDHGTHVAGTIGAVGGNGRGVAGVCWSVKLLNAKFLGSTGGTTANAVKAVDYFTTLKTRQNLNIVATSNSWGGGGFSQSLQDAIERANAAGILFIAAAGNSTLDCDTSSACYPAEYPNANIISVASITSTGGLSSFSNYGATTIDIGAPGSGIWSTVPVRQNRRTVSGYASYSGTSMATPHVSGAAALYKALNPNATAAQVKAAILNSAVPTPSLQGKTVTGGRLNVGAF
ncbi:MAG: S8 family serine peptidase, partial [Parvularculaceae bacterium]|nr:S8 family serine peptidase [Parvularculaceae bacterium]